jgi:hypothetical protein
MVCDPIDAPWANGILCVVVVCPSLQMAVVNPVAKSLLTLLATVEEIVVPVT